MRTTTVDSYCSFTGDACLHGTISVTLSGLSLPAGTYELVLSEIGNATRLAEQTTLAVSGGTATADLSLDTAALASAIGARRQLDAQLYLLNLTANVVAWNGPMTIMRAPEP